MRPFTAAIVVVILVCVAMIGKSAQNQALDLVLPTDNDALFSGDGAAFYQYVERNY